MATDYYVDADKADDTGDGLSWANAKKHVSAAVGLLSYPVTDDTTIHLKEGTTNDYEETSNGDKLEITGCNCVGSGSLTIQTENWNESNYDSENSPVGGASFNPKEDKPVTLPFRIDISASNNISFKGILFEQTDSSNVEGGIEVHNYSYNVNIHYCSIELFFTGVHVYGNSAANVYNSYLLENNVGATAMYHSQLTFNGDNYVQDSVRYGVGVYQDSSVGFYPWDDYLFEVFTTRISTTSPRKFYSAVAAASNARVFVRNDEFNPINPAVGLVKIIDELAERKLKTEEYYGVKLFARSLLTGMDNIRFAEDSTNDGNDTVPIRRQIVGTNGSEAY